MSFLAARNARDQIHGRPSLVSPAYLTPVSGVGTSAIAPIMADLRALETADPVLENAAWQERKATLAAAYFNEVSSQDKPFAFSNGYAIIPIHGMLINRYAWSWGYVTGYNFIRQQVQAAEADDDVKGIVYDVNSCGGMAAGCQETADVIASGKKPSVAVVDANCFSAAYFLASQARSVRSTPSGGCGSIGVVICHMDFSKALEDMGIEITFVTAGEHKVDGNSAEPLSKDARESFQAAVDACYDVFVSYVADGRGLDEQDVRDTEARCYDAADALTLGLIDAIANPSDAVESFFTECDADDSDDTTQPQETTDMNPRQQAAAPAAAATVDEAGIRAEAASEARTSERQRISAITGHAEAQGREEQARYLAYDTDMSADQAVAILKTAPKPAAAAAPAAGATGLTGASGPTGASGLAAGASGAVAETEANFFRQAMDHGKHPEVGAGGGDPENMSASKRILANYKGIAGSA